VHMHAVCGSPVAGLGCVGHPYSELHQLLRSAYDTAARNRSPACYHETKIIVLLSYCFFPPFAHGANATATHTLNS
jgi:hypothetical protein